MTNPLTRRLLVAALALAAVAPVAAFAQDSSSSKAPAADAAFVKQASAGGLAEVSLGQLGASQGNSADVKSFGQQMVKDHTAANDELKSIASGKNIDVAMAPMAADEKAAKMIGAKSGNAFDQAFTKKMIADHKKTIALFKKESMSGKDPELKAFATKTLPTLNEHLQMAQKLPGASGSAMAAN